MKISKKITTSPASSSPRIVQTVGSISLVNAASPLVPVYECPQCLRPFKLYKSVQRHMREKRHRGDIQPPKIPSAQSTEIQYQCPDCEANFQHLSELRQHMETADHASVPLQYAENTNASGSPRKSQPDGPPYNCKRCPENFPLRSELRQHLREKHGVQSTSFLKVKAVASSPSRSPSFSSLHCCEKCGKGYKYPSELQRHRERKADCSTQNTPSKAPINSERNVSAEDLHGPPFRCMKCVYVFTYKHNLVKHLKSDHGIIVDFRCQDCSSVFSDSNSLREHVMQEHGHGLYACKFCDQKFAWRKSLRKHIEGKHKNAPASTPLLQTTSGEPVSQGLTIPLKPYNCSKCRAAFKLQRNLRVHMMKCGLSATSKKGFGCSYCHVVFTWWTQAQRHIERRHPGKPIKTVRKPVAIAMNQPGMMKQKADTVMTAYCCKYCPQRFVWKWSLQRHFKQKHPDKKFEAVKRQADFPEREVTPQTLGRNQCKLCGLRFMYDQSLRRHMKKKHPYSNVKIKTEPGVTAENTGLYKPATSVSSKESSVYQCAQCFYIFRHRNYWQTHVIKKKHRGDPIVLPTSALGMTHQCAVCNESYYEEAMLKKHIRQTGHQQTRREFQPLTGDTPHVSSEVQVDTIPEPMEYDSRRQWCHICKVMLKSKQQYKRHLLGPLHEKRAAKLRASSSCVHKCPKCDKAFESTITLQRHQKMMNHRAPASQIVHQSVPNTVQSSTILISPTPSPVKATQHRPESKLPEKTMQQGLGSALTITGDECYVCKKSCGDSRRLKLHLAGAKHKVGHLRMLLKVKAARKRAGIVEKEPEMKCLVCHREYSNNYKLRKHLSATKHMSEHDRLAKLPDNLNQCLVCHKEYGDYTKLRKHLSAYNHRIEHDRLAHGRPTPQKIASPATKYITEHDRLAKLPDNPNQCLVCHREYGDYHKLRKHLSACNHRIEHDRLAPERPKPQKLASPATKHITKHDRLAILPDNPNQCLVCYREYDDYIKLRKHLSATNHRTEHDRLAPERPKPHKIASPMKLSSNPNQCLECCRIYDDQKRLSKHLSNTSHRAEHDRLTELMKELAAKDIDITKPVPEDQCLACGKLTGDRKKLGKHFHNCKACSRQEHLRVQALLPSSCRRENTPNVCAEESSKNLDVSMESVDDVSENPAKTGSDNVKEYKCLHCLKTFSDNKELNKHLYNENHIKEHDRLNYKPATSHKCLHCLKAFPDSKALNKHLYNDNHIKEHDRLNYKQMMKAVVSPPIVQVEKLDNEKSPPQKLPVKSMQTGVEGSSKSSIPPSRKSAFSGPKIQGKRDPRRCLVCGMKYRDRKALRKHLSNAKHRVQHDEMDQKLSRNPSFGSSQSTQKMLIKRSLFRPSHSKLSCEQCHRTFQNLKVLRLHMRKEGHSSSSSGRKLLQINRKDTTSPLKKPDSTAEGNFQCYLCERAFPMLSNLKKHVFNGHGQFWQPEDERTPSVEKDSAETLSKSTDESFECHICEKTFGTLTPMKQHLFASHGQFLPPGADLPKEKPPKPADYVFKCALCHKQFPTLKRLKQHTFAAHHKHWEPGMESFQQERTQPDTAVVYPPALPVSTKQRQHILDNLPHVLVHKLSLDPIKPDLQEAEEQLYRCEAKEAQSLYTQLKKHLKTLAELEKSSDMTKHSEIDHGLQKNTERPGPASQKRRKYTEQPQVDTESSGPTPQKRSKLAPEKSEHSATSSTSTDGKVKCTTCDMTFSTVSSMNRHKKLKRHRWYCPFCPVYFTNLARKNAHILTHEQTASNDNLNQSGNKAKTSESAFKDDAETSQRDLSMNFSDDDSDGGFPVLPQLDESDDEDEPGGMVYDCSHCSERFANKKDLLQHKTRRHVDIIFKCKKCPQQFDTQLELLNHMLMHRSSTPQQELKKSRAKETQESAQESEGEAVELDMSVEEGSPMHNPWSDGETNMQAENESIPRNAETQNKHTSQQKSAESENTQDQNDLFIGECDSVLTCSQCGRTFDSDAQLEQHIIKDHISIVPQVYQCKICKVTYKHKSSYIRHMQRGKHKQVNMQHKGSSNSEDGESSNDGKAASDGSNSGDTIRPYQCAQCSSSFIYKSSYVKHMKEGLHDPNTQIIEEQMIAEKRYECPECASTFLYERGLVMHIKNGIHRVCKVCRSEFSDSVALRAHMAVHVSREDQTALGGLDDERRTESDMAALPGEDSDGPMSPNELLEWIAEAKERSKASGPATNISSQPCTSGEYSRTQIGINTHSSNRHIGDEQHSPGNLSFQNQVDGAQDMRLSPEKLIKEEHAYALQSPANVGFECDACQQRFKYKVILNQHRKKCGWKCAVCNQLFSTVVDLITHRKEKHDGDEDLVSDSEDSGSDCEETTGEQGTTSHSVLRRLVTSIPVDNKRPRKAGYELFQCSLCETALHSKKAFTNHQINKHNLAYKCGMCDKRFTGQSNRSQHEVNYHRMRRVDNKLEEARQKYKCGICGTGFLTETKCSQHMEMHSNGIQCKICLKPFGSEKVLEHHLWGKHRVEIGSHKQIEVKLRHKCGICEMLFTMESAYKAHMKLHEEGIQCKLCFRVFMDEGQLTNHMSLKHKINSRTFQCSICSKEFKTAVQLDKHILFHSHNLI